MRKDMMMEGITDITNIIGSMAFETGFMPDSDEEGNLIQSKELASQYKKRIMEHVKNGEILRYSSHYQITGYKEFDDFIQGRLQKEVDKLNEEYYGRKRYLRIKQCM
jgi:hypothetical protein